jgi:hypothetical protein
MCKWKFRSKWIYFGTLFILRKWLEIFHLSLLPLQYGYSIKMEGTYTRNEAKENALVRLRHTTLSYFTSPPLSLPLSFSTPLHTSTTYRPISHPLLTMSFDVLKHLFGLHAHYYYTCPYCNSLFPSYSHPLLLTSFPHPIIPPNILKT